MNIPYIKEVNSEGKVTNFPETGKYVNVYPNRQQRNKVASRVIPTNKKGVSLVVGPRFAFKIQMQRIGASISKTGEFLKSRWVMHYVPKKINY